MNNMKDLAKQIARARALQRLERQKTESTGDKPPNPNDVYHPPDSWAPEFRQEKELPLQRDAKPRTSRAREANQKEVPETSKLDISDLSTKRVNKIAISMSDAEIALLKHYLHQKGWSLSRWARNALFEAAGISLPRDR